jgi:hypothetical protein
MKPAVCCVCGTSALDDKSGEKGGWVEFEDYRHESSGSLSHPIGLEYFCSEHFSEAKRMRHIKSDEALAEMKLMFPSKRSSVLTANNKPPWWRRWISR